jgi:hypothetical protein
MLPVRRCREQPHSSVVVSPLRLGRSDIRVFCQRAVSPCDWTYLPVLSSAPPKMQVQIRHPFLYHIFQHSLVLQFDVPIALVSGVHACGRSTLWSAQPRRMVSHWFRLWVDPTHLFCSHVLRRFRPCSLLSSSLFLGSPTLMSSYLSL